MRRDVTRRQTDRLTGNYQRSHLRLHQFDPGLTQTDTQRHLARQRRIQTEIQADEQQSLTHG